MPHKHTNKHTSHTITENKKINFGPLEYVHCIVLLYKAIIDIGNTWYIVYEHININNSFRTK